MSRKLVFAIALIITLTSVPIVVLKIRNVQASVWNTIYIRDDGSIDPPDAPIQHIGDLYTLTDNISIYYSGSGSLGILIERNNMTLDGAGYSIIGTFEQIGITLSERTNVTIRNMKFSASAYWGFKESISIKNSSHINIVGNNATNGAGSVFLRDSSDNSIVGNIMAVYLFGSSNNSIVGNIMTGRNQGISLDNSSFNNIVGNDIGFSSQYDLVLINSSDNSIFHNNFMMGEFTEVRSSNSSNVWDDGYPSGGNYWSNYPDVDLYSGPYQNETGSDGIEDTPHLLAPGNRDNYPFINNCYEFDVAITNLSPYQVWLTTEKSLAISVTVKNEGYSSSPVTFNLTLEANGGYNPQTRAVKLQANAAQGWNYSIPGPTITSSEGDTVELTLEAADTLHHKFYVDYNGNGFPDTNEPQTASFINTTTKLDLWTQVPGNFTYYCAYHQDTMFGPLIVSEFHEETRQIGSQNVTLAKLEKKNVTFNWNTTGLRGWYTIKAIAHAVPGEIDLTDNIFIIPEFPSFLILPLFMIATLLPVIVHKRKHSQ